MKSRSGLKLALLIGASCATLILAWLYLRPIPQIQANPSTIPSIPSASFAPAWPPYGQSSIGAVGYGLLDTHGQLTPHPTASVAKIITALAVLQKHPLKLGESGPVLTLDTQDVQFFNNHYLVGGSVVAVKNGEQITEYQALQAMLLPSGNNMADSLVRWAFGSQEKYLPYANNMLEQARLKDTRVADASGLSPSTVSTATDLLELAQRAIGNPVLAQIVGQQTAIVPVAGTVKNVNWLLGEDGVVGIKTGNTDQAGGNFMFAANRSIDNRKVEALGVILGAPLRTTALSDSRALIQSIDAGFENKLLIKKGQVAGTYELPWGGYVNAVAKEDLHALVWKNKPITFKASLTKIPFGSQEGTTAGKIIAKNADREFAVPVVLESYAPKPPYIWRLLRN